MPRNIRLTVCLTVLLCRAVTLAHAASSQIQTDSQVPTSKSTVAFVYVIDEKFRINAFAAASDGQLTTVKGSPFPSAVLNMAVNGTYLFATDTVHIYSYSIASNGAIKQVASINALKFNDGNCGT